MACTEFKGLVVRTESTDATVRTALPAPQDTQVPMGHVVCRVCPETRDPAERLARAASTRRATRETAAMSATTVRQVKWATRARRVPRDTKDWQVSM